MGADPDAMWKPGFSGEVVVRTPTATRRHARARWWVAGAVVVLAAASAVVVIVRRADPAAESSAIERIPTAVGRRWTATVPGVAVTATATHDLVVVVTEGDGIVALRRDTGGRRWVRAVPGTDVFSIAVVDGIVVAGTEGDGRTTLIGLDADTGEVLWRHPLQVPDASATVGARGAVVVWHAPDVGRATGVDLLDPRTGAMSASISGSTVLIGPDTIQVRSGDSFEVYERATFRRTGAVGAPSLHGHRAFLVPVADGLLALTAGRVTLLDLRGHVRASLSLAVSSPSTLPIGIPLPGSAAVAVQVDGRLDVLDTSGGRLQRLWSRPVGLVDDVAGGGHPVLAVLPPSYAGAPPDDTPVTLLDAERGRQLWSGRADLSAAVEFLTTTGFVASERGRDGERDVAGVDLGGHVRWRHPVGRGRIALLVDDGLVELGPADGADGSAVTLYG